jgi:hypothetical protein
MNNSILRSRLLAILILLPLIFVITNCNEEDDNVTPEEIASIEGRWSATANFGGFEMVVNEEETYITELTYKFSDFRCGGLIQSGNITISSTPGWPITNLAFNISRDLDPDPFEERNFTISGSFSADKKTADGDWNTRVGSSPCSGVWQAAPVN